MTGESSASAAGSIAAALYDLPLVATGTVAGLTASYPSGDLTAALLTLRPALSTQS